MSKNEIIKITYEISLNLAKEIESIQRSCGSIKESELDSHYPDVGSYLSLFARLIGNQRFLSRRH